MYEDDPLACALVYEALWDVRDARWTRRGSVPRGRVAGLLALVAEVIAHHDVYRPDAPTSGAGRVSSIVDHASSLAADVERNPDRYCPVAAGFGPQAKRWDLTLLARASRAPAEIFRLAVWNEAYEVPEEDRDWDYLDEASDKQEGE